MYAHIDTYARQQKWKDGADRGDCRPWPFCDRWAFDYVNSLAYRGDGTITLGLGLRQPWDRASFG